MVEVKQKWQIICPVALYIYNRGIYTNDTVRIYIYIHTYIQEKVLPYDFSKLPSTDPGSGWWTLRDAKDLPAKWLSLFRVFAKPAGFRQTQ